MPRVPVAGRSALARRTGAPAHALRSASISSIAFGTAAVRTSCPSGDWFHDSGELHSCVVAFPIQVEASLVINSARGFAPYQCDLLETAFDNAWVAG